jgi:magnesium transporter
MPEDVISMEKSQTGIILGKNYVISLQDSEDQFQNLYRLLEEQGTRIRKMGADYLVYAMLDTVVNAYFRVSEKIGEWLETLQDEAIMSTNRDVLQRIMVLRRQLVTFRRAIWPLREQINELERGESELIRDEVGPYFRDVYNHTVELMDTIDTSRDILSEMIDVYQTGISNQLNKIVKILTAITVIFTPATFIASWYGMNFKNMPELNSPWGYPIALMAFLLSSLVLLLWFKRKGWF